MVGRKPLNPDQKGLLELNYLIRMCHQGGYVVDLCSGSGSGCIGLRMAHSVSGFDLSKDQVAGATHVANFLRTWR